MFKHKITSQLVIRSEKAMRSILIKHPRRRTEQSKPLPEETQQASALNAWRTHCSEAIPGRWETKILLFSAALLFSPGWEDPLHLPRQCCTLAACRASASAQRRETPPSFCNSFSCLQTVQPDLAGLINHTSTALSSEMFYCSNEARALRGGSYHYVHLTAKEMEAEM